MRDIALAKPLPAQAAEMARQRRFFGIRKRQGVAGCSGLGIIDTDACLWARTIRPDDMETLYIVPSLPTIKMKPAPADEEYYDGITEEDSSGFVCTVNRFVNEHPILSIAGLAAVLLFGTASGGAARKRKVTVRKRGRR